jgi:peptidoglycan/LPS O-acetylase OafA/YrhL
MNYRGEIDGLRALAVLPVIFFHSGLVGFSGGFVGVDIFFVISGYLITSLIFAEMQEGHFSIFSFYVRRMRRILPALLLVMVITFFFSWLWMVPDQLIDFGKSVVAVCLFVSNFYFWKATDYFGPNAELQPLLHTWSLAVEEQFYIFFPALLLFLFKFAKARIVPILATLAALSFAWAQWGHITLPETRFYMTYTRIWELLLGSLTALNFPHRPRFSPAIEELLVVSGLMFIALSIMLFRQELKYPSAFTLMPTIGAGLIILYGDRSTYTGKLLSSWVVAGLGLLSYSAYLWHQPILALARLRSVEPPSTWILAILGVSSFGLAYLSWRFIEKPFRNRELVGPRAFFTSISVLLVLLLIGSSTISTTAGFEMNYLSRLNSQQQHDYSLVLAAIKSNGTAGMLGNDDCRFWESSVSVNFINRFDRCVEKYGKAYVVIGDSHAMDLYNALFQAANYPFIVGILKESCNPGKHRESRCPYPSIIKFSNDRSSSIEHLILTLSGSHFSADSSGTVLRNDNFDAVVDFIRKLPKGLDVIWLGPQVEPGVDLRDINPLMNKYPQPNPNALTQMINVDKLISDALSKETDIRYMSKIKMVNFDIEKDFLVDGEYSYADTHHWSTFGEALFGARIVKALHGIGFVDL